MSIPFQVPMLPHLWSAVTPGQLSGHPLLCKQPTPTALAVLAHRPPQLPRRAHHRLLSYSLTVSKSHSLSFSPLNKTTVNLF